MSRRAYDKSPLSCAHRGVGSRGCEDCGDRGIKKIALNPKPFKSQFTADADAYSVARETEILRAREVVS